MHFSLIDEDLIRLNYFWTFYNMNFRREASIREQNERLARAQSAKMLELRDRTRQRQLLDSQRQKAVLDRRKDLEELNALKWVCINLVFDNIKKDY